LETITVLGNYTSPELDREPDPGLAVKIPDPAKRSGSDWIPDQDPQHWTQVAGLVDLKKSLYWASCEFLLLFFA
jgi:hypothetical protein